MTFTYPSAWGGGGGGIADAVGKSMLAGQGAAAVLSRAPFGGGVCVDWWLACGVLQWFSVMRRSHCWLAFGRGAAGARGVFGAGSCGVAHCGEGLISVFREVFASIGKGFVLAGALSTGLLFYGVLRLS